VMEQSRSDQPFSGRVFCGAAESFAGAVLPPAVERAMQDSSSGEIEWLAVVAQAAGDLAVVEEPRPWSERETVGVRVASGSDRCSRGSLRVVAAHRRFGSASIPIRLLRGARLLDAREQRLDGAVVRGPVPVELGARAAPGVAGLVGALPPRTRSPRL
jgi:hypothetical protein